MKALQTNKGNSDDSGQLHPVVGDSDLHLPAVIRLVRRAVGRSPSASIKSIRPRQIIDGVLTRVYAVGDENNANNITVKVHRLSTGGLFSYRRGVTGQSTLNVPEANRRLSGEGDATTLDLRDPINRQGSNKPVLRVPLPGRTERNMVFTDIYPPRGLGGDRPTYAGREG